ncbi:hypothetical protein SAMN03080594_110123 [Arenibacter palladensis]|uniref:Uncharacterized protein n=1 Tax=Arenibacter palladensis TaxID=237373 RepID=A0A1M5G5L3_9FLAO|nr:hypothetical protein SAMN03080594_110123 [Arenibacter palladensis]
MNIKDNNRNGNHRLCLLMIMATEALKNDKRVILDL